MTTVKEKGFNAVCGAFLIGKLASSFTLLSATDLKKTERSMWALKTLDNGGLAF